MTLTESQNRISQLEARCSSIANDLERVTGERDAARQKLESLGWASDSLRDALKNWDFNAPSEFWIDVTPETRDAFTALKAYRATRDGQAA